MVFVKVFRKVKPFYKDARRPEQQKREGRDNRLEMTGGGKEGKVVKKERYESLHWHRS